MQVCRILICLIHVLRSSKIHLLRLVNSIAASSEAGNPQNSHLLTWFVIGGSITAPFLNNSKNENGQDARGGNPHEETLCRLNRIVSRSGRTHVRSIQ